MTKISGTKISTISKSHKRNLESSLIVTTTAQVSELTTSFIELGIKWKAEALRNPNRSTERERNRLERDLDSQSEG